MGVALVQVAIVQETIFDNLFCTILKTFWSKSGSPVSTFVQKSRALGVASARVLQDCVVVSLFEAIDKPTFSDW